MRLTDTPSSSWQDTGADERTDGDSVTGEADSSLWSPLDSVTVHLTDSGREILRADESDCGSRPLVSQSEPFDLQDSLSENSSRSGTVADPYHSSGPGKAFPSPLVEIVSDGQSFSDEGIDNLCVSLSAGSDGTDTLPGDNATGDAIDNEMNDIDSLTTFGAAIPGLFFSAGTDRAPEDSSEGSGLSETGRDPLRWAYDSPAFDLGCVAGSNPIESTASRGPLCKDGEVKTGGQTRTSGSGLDLEL
jgi:hypothetical protein